MLSSRSCSPISSSYLTTMDLIETPDDDISLSDIYTSLGISKPLKKGCQEPPRVLSIISSLLERTVQRNEKTVKASRCKEMVTIFDGTRPPPLSVRKYIDWIFRYASCSPSCFVLAHMFMERFLDKPDLCLTSLNVHRLLITSVVVTTKFIDDSFFNNVYFAKVGGISTTEMNRLELKFLFGMDFRYAVSVVRLRDQSNLADVEAFGSVEAFGKYYMQLEKEGIGGVGCQIERSIQSCRLNDWANAEEVGSQQRVQLYSCGAV